MIAGASVNDDVDIQELEDLSDDCVVAVHGGSGPTMTPPWLSEVYFRP